MPKHDFYQLDVFTDVPLTGNPLAVFPDGDGLTDEQMQGLAREMNLSETTFVFPSDEGDRSIRFFTPRAEIPLAGHPTIGTWWLLAELGLIDVPEQGDQRFLQQTGAGVLPVDIFMAGGKPDRVEMTQAVPEFGNTVTDITGLGKALGGEDPVAEPLPQVVSTGMPQMMIPVKSREALSQLPSGGTGAALAGLLRSHGSDCAMCFHLTEPGHPARIKARMFAPGLGVPEDPATGSAAGALGAYIVWHGLLRPTDGVARMVIEQGEEIGRPSRIQVEVCVGNGGEITEVKVGGQAVQIIKGEVTL